MLDLLAKEHNEETLDAHIANFGDTGEASDRLSTRRLTSKTFMEPIATLMRRETDVAVEGKNYSMAFVLKNTIHITEMYNDFDYLRRGSLYSGTD